MVADATIDTACISSGCTAVYATENGALSLQRVTIRGSRGGGLARGRRAFIWLRDVVIEGNAGVGLDLGGHILHNSLRNFGVEGDLRISGNGYPAHLATHDIPQLLPTPGSVERIVGNQHDTLIVGITYFPESFAVPAAVPWRVYDGVSSASGYASMPPAIEPGATLVGWARGPWGRVRLAIVAGTVFEGAPGKPISFADVEVSVLGQAGDTTHLRHIRVGPGAVATTRHFVFGSPTTSGPIVLEDVDVRDGRVELTTTGSRIERLNARGGISDTLATVWLVGAGMVARDLQVLEAPGPAIVLNGDDILLEHCQAMDGMADGVQVLAGAGIRIRACNLQGNAGAGVANAGADVVDARENWWGDPEGPFGPAGDSVIGQVVFTPWRTAPAPPLGELRRFRH
jgi:hypothetical protein